MLGICDRSILFSFASVTYECYLRNFDYSTLMQIIHHSRKNNLDFNILCLAFGNTIIPGIIFSLWCEVVIEVNFWLCRSSRVAH